MNMKTMPVGELKANFSAILDSVQHGEKIGILYGKKKKPIAMIVPFVEEEPKGKRKLGILEGKAKVHFHDDFGMTEEELLGIACEVST